RRIISRSIASVGSYRSRPGMIWKLRCRGCGRWSNDCAPTLASSEAVVADCPRYAAASSCPEPASASVESAVRLATVGLFTFILAACGTTAPSQPLGPGPSAALASATATACPVEVTVTVTGTELRREVIVSAENRHTSAQELVLPDRCPSGPLEFIGLPGDYDY